MDSLQISGPHMSLSALHWADIPRLAIVTGPNGVGKTQLLRLLAFELDALRSGIETLFARPAMQIEPRPASVGYLPAIWQHGTVKISHEFFEPVDKLLWTLGRRSREVRNLDEFAQAIAGSLTGELKPMAARLLEVLHSRGQLTLPVSRAAALAALGPGDLSSGEQAVLALVAVVVTESVLGPAPSATEHNPELLLLDEPDSHLHTSGVKNYLEHVQQLTTRGIQIIMVTHRPPTRSCSPRTAACSRCAASTTGYRSSRSARRVSSLAAWRPTRSRSCPAYGSSWSKMKTIDGFTSGPTIVRSGSSCSPHPRASCSCPSTPGVEVARTPS